MKQIIGSILDVTEGIIVQQVNCQGVMGAGLARQIRQKYPRVYSRYKDECGMLGFENLGSVSFTQVDEKLLIASIFGQLRCGRDRSVVYTDYNALRRGLKIVSNSKRDSSVYIPHSIGCGLANGDWNVVLSIIEETIPDAIIVKWDGRPFG